MKPYGLLGEKLGHSFSPRIHALLGKALGLEYPYRLFEVPPEGLEDFLKHGNFAGLNVTIPYKKAVLPYCGALSPKAAAIGSVNTLVRRPDGTLFGDNTDYDGFVHMLNLLGLDLRGKKCLVLGSGGASLTVQAALRDRGGAEIVVISRRGENNYENLHRHKDAQVLVNTTPVGMYPDNGAAPVSLEAFPVLEAVLDLIYNPAKTTLLLQAEDRGISSINGLPMLVAQAARAAELFTSRSVPAGVIESVTRKLERESKNVALIGMPGCGKSSVGRRLAELTGRPFFDCDAEITSLAGRPPSEILLREGEEAFRRLEHEVLRELSARSGAVIATGGGVVTRPENRPLLRQNSVVVYLRRPLEDLPTHGRPLSQREGLDALYERRAPLYEAWNDLYIDAGASVEETARNLKERLGL